MIRHLMLAMVVSYMMTWSALHWHRDPVWHMVWPAECIDHVDKSPDMVMMAPLKKDGTPDMTKAMVLRTVVVYRPDCGRIEKVKEE